MQKVIVVILLTTLVAAQPSLCLPPNGNGRTQVELNSGWVCKNIKQEGASGERLSTRSYPLSRWMPATVPGTVLTMMLNNKLVPDPFYGMNNAKIPDIYQTGSDYYTYWFVNDFQTNAPHNGEQVWLDFRGVNYSCELYLNGRKLNKTTHRGMFLRQSYNITSFLSSDGKNRLAVLVYPPDPAGDPNGGQGGDGTIAHSITNQYVAGWDWIQPIRDRNTGIWDKVTIKRTNTIRLKNPYVITIVPGKRFPGEPQSPAIIRASAEIENPTGKEVRGTLRYVLEGNTVEKEAVLPPDSTTEIHLPDLLLQQPRLWWPNGYGGQPLYSFEFQFINSDNNVLDAETVVTGVREIQTQWNSHTNSREVLVNGQKIFIKGGDWIISDAMLRFSRERYDAEIRFHRDMNLNLIRIWGGAITERPEFYEACDKYGLLVFQDLWISGDCNGKWFDASKKDDQWTRRNYPDDHRLFLTSLADQLKMNRNHPSLAFYCGGNEIPPPEDILFAMKDSLLPALDSARYLFEYSNVDSMSYNSLGGNGDGPYRIEPVNFFWDNHFFPFNSEIGSVGVGDDESLQRFIPKENMAVPDLAANKIDSVWRYHKFSGYGKFIDAYGKPATVRDFAAKAQLVNYDEYRGLMEGHIDHMWDWYTGVIIWKTQNPWTALRGQMYDYYLDPNACLYGLHHANEPVHAMYDPTDGMLVVANHTFVPYRDVMLQARAFDMGGKDTLVFQWIIQISPTTTQKISSIKETVDKLFSAQGCFLSLRLINASHKTLSDNFYWLPDSTGNYSGLRNIAKAKLETEAKKAGEGRIEVSLENPAGSPVAFFNRVSLIDMKTKKRLLPVFYSDNYVSVLPGEEKKIFIDSPSSVNVVNSEVSISGWNVEEALVRIK
ncbi:MAG TPA: glycoside hydrolase family 2 TIM barrel-domain containing protein [Bacteroidota bacterium]|nr:glycoside hydrolase family 2 TIM barrel-domain containing protein [Bacteroidota bacterium]